MVHRLQKMASRDSSLPGTGCPVVLEMPLGDDAGTSYACPGQSAAGSGE